jgi:hypothetical protein
LEKRNFVITEVRRADISARRQHVVMTPNLLQLRRLAEPRLVLVALPLTPRMKGPGDLRDVLVRELFPCPVYQRPELARVNEEDLAAPVPQLVTGLLVAS